MKTATLLVSLCAAIAIGNAPAIIAQASAETYETPFGDVTADQQFSLSEPSYRYEFGYADPTGTFSFNGWSEARPDYGAHSNVTATLGDTTVSNHQHYGYEGNLLENKFVAGDLAANTTVSSALIPGQQVFYNGECVWGCPVS